jgi:cytochrome b561
MPNFSRCTFSLGVLLGMVLLCRIVWRAGPGRSLMLATTGPIEVASKLAHYVLYLLLVAVVGFGLCMPWAGHGAIRFFGLFAIPSRFSVNHDLAHLLFAMHSWAATALIILAGLHACAALFHHLVLRDNVLRRMLPSGKQGHPDRNRPIKKHARARFEAGWRGLGSRRYENALQTPRVRSALATEL